MEKYYPTLQYVVVDLTKEKWSVHILPPSIFSSYLGGNGLGLYLYDVHCGEKDENCEQSPLVFTTGLFTQFRMIDKDSLTITGQSTHSNMVRSATASTTFASHLISCGFCGLILIGSARRPMVLDIAAQDIIFTPTEKLLNKRVSETVNLLNLTSSQASIVIGPGGENNVPFSSLVSDGKSLDREGFGAFLGAKRIKAIVIEKGPYSSHNIYQKEVDLIFKEIDTKVSSSRYYKKEESENHLSVLKNANDGGFAGVAHTTKRCDPRMTHLYGRTYPSLYSHPFYLQLGTLYIADKSGNKVLMNSDTMIAFGSNIKNYDPSLCATYTHLSVDLGLDPISTAMTLSWVMEGEKRGIVKDIPLSYEDHSQLEEIIESVAFLTGVGKKIAKGSVSLAKEYKNEEFITCVHNKEMLPYDPRGAYGQGLLMALGYDFLHPDEVLLEIMPLTEIKGKGASVILSEQLYIISCALGVNFKKLVALLYESSLHYLFSNKNVKKNTSLLEQVVHYLLDEEVDLYSVAKRTLELEERINGVSRAKSATLPLQFLLNGDSNYTKESIVPLTKLLNEYKVLYEIELIKMK